MKNYHLGLNFERFQFFLKKFIIIFKFLQSKSYDDFSLDRLPSSSSRPKQLFCNFHWPASAVLLLLLISFFIVLIVI